MNIPLDLNNWQDFEKNYPNLIYAPAPRTTINVCGHIYEIYTAILDAYPETLLGDAVRREKYRLISHETNSQLLFFHRHPTLFSYILYYYIQGFIHRPINIPYDIFIEECRFFSIPIDHNNENENILRYSSSWKMNKIIEENLITRVMHWIGFLVTIISCFIFFVDDLPTSSRMYSEFKYGGKLIHHFISSNIYLTLIDMGCATWFMIEFFTRFFFLSTHRVLEPFIDIISILPIFLTVMIETISQWFAFTGHLVALCICLKAFRVVRFIRYIPSLKLIVETFAISLNEVATVLVLCSIAIIPFGTAIFILEQNDPRSNIVDPSIGLWWAIETLTTIGFGEHVPHSFEGRSLSILACVLGLTILAMPIPLVFKKFQIVYQNSWKRHIWSQY